MKKLLTFLLTTAVLFTTACSESYDDSALVNRIDNLEGRVQKLEQLCQQMNTNISSLQTIVTALQNNDYITNITPITENGKAIGYKITFAKAQPITIYHGQDGKDGQDGADGKDGKDGKDGYTPVIGVKQDTDGIYYWTLDGEWLLDENGEKVKAVGQDGKDGKDGVTPLLKIEDDYWFISYDNGVSWTQLGKATGEDGQNGAPGANGTDGKNGDSFFQSVTQDSQYVYFTLADGSTITLPKGASLDITFAESDLVVMSPNSTREIAYAVQSVTEKVTVEVTSSADIKAKVMAADASGRSGKIVITTSTTIDEYSKVIVFVSNGEKVIMKSILFEEAGLVVADSATTQASSDGGEVVLEFLSNVECEVVIPEDAQSWISIVPNSRALERQSITLQLEPNEGAHRSTKVTVKSTDSKLTLEYTIEQEANLDYQLAMEREALIAFYNATGGDNWTRNDNWCSDKPVSEWYGVEVNDVGLVFRLSLMRNNLRGEITKELGNLQHLWGLTLGYNYISGKIPAEIGNLTRLEYLSLNDNQLIGDIPPQIGNCTQLIDITLFSNKLSGTIPSEIGNCTQLEYLWLDTNNLTGSIPAEIGCCTNLKVLTIHGSNLYGEIPREIGNCTLLEVLNLACNNLTGNIPSEIGNLHKLRTLSLQENDLDGEIPHTIGNLHNLESLHIYSNKISGNIPQSMSQMQSLKLLHLGWNNLSGEIPSHLGCCPSLEELHLYNNNFTGEIPEELGNIKTLNYLNVHENQLTGEIPSEISKLQNLEILDLTYNQLTGVIPDEFVNLHKLKNLALGYNKLNGILSEALSSYLEDIDSFFIEQQAGYELVMNHYISTDFSQDGKVVTLQQHTKGPGIKFVITTDGFSDRQITNGIVDSYIQATYDALFSEEPYTSFKDYFDVYAVLTISKREKIGNDTALGTVLASDTSTGDFVLHHEKIETYANMIPAISNDISNTHIVVILNDKTPRRASCWQKPYGSISCTTIYTPDTPELDGGGLDKTVRHEVLGHGFGKLGDEYVELYPLGQEDLYAVFPENQKQDIWDYHNNGWYLNVDVTNDPEKVIWKEFLSNKDYVSENIGIYEGALYYETGAYRATPNSIMNDNMGGFNAPSRWAIYKHIMEIAGEEYSFDTFLEYDKKNLVQTRSAVSKSAQQTSIDPSKLGAKPRFLNR